MRRQALGATLLGTVLLVSAATAPVVLAATSTDTAPEGVHALYADGGTLHAVEPDGSIHDYGVSVEIVGPAADLDGDGVLETPFVDSSGALRMVEPDGTAETLAERAKYSKSAIAVADYDGDGTKAVFYANTSDSNRIYKVEVGTSPSDPVRVVKAAANGIAGTGDFDGDNETELVFAGTSSTIKYLDNGTVVSTGTSDIGSNNGYGLGDVADLDGDGTARVTVVTGSGNLALIGHEGNKQTIKDPPAAKSGISTVDWDGNGDLEILYRNTDGKLAYANLDGSHQQIGDANGTAIAADASAGVVATTGLAAPRITNYSVTNPAGRAVNVSFTSNTNLTNITVEVDGPDPTTLQEGAFDVAGDGPYTYTATYTADSDGEYNATLVRAVGPNGNDGADGESGTVTIETPEPSVRNATIADARDDDGVVAGNHTVEVTAEVPDTDPENVTVEANASAFGAGTVTLSHAGGSTWSAEFTVDGANVSEDGAQAVTVTATNQYGNTATNATGTLVVDTTAPDADAGPNRTTGVDMDVQFDGDGTTDRTEIVRYNWSFGDGTTATGVSPVHSYDEAGTYTVTLTVEDTAGNVATDTLTVDVREDIQLRVRNATIRDGSGSDSDGVVTGNDTVVVTADVPDTDPENVTVEADARAFGAGEVVLTHENGTTWSAEFVVDGANVSEDGEQSVLVTATTQNGVTASNETGTLLVDTTAPVADAGPNRTAGVGMEIHFDGDGTTDRTEIVRYQWSFGDGTTATGVSPTHSYEEPGTYTVTLTVEDSAGNTATDTLTVNVSETAEDVTVVRTVESDSTDEPSGTTDETANTDDGTTPEPTSVETTTVETTVVRETVRVSVTHAETGNPISIDVPTGVTEGDVVTLGSLTLRPQRGGPFELTIGGNVSAPAGVPAVTQHRVTQPLGYWELEHSIDDANVSGVTFVFSVDADRLGGASPDAVTLYRFHDGNWTAYDAQPVGRANGSYQYRVRSPGLSVFAVGIQEPVFDVVNATLSTDRVRVDETVAVTATVANDGSTAATRTLALAVGNETAGRKTVTVPAGDERTVTFVTTPNRTGTFSVTVGNRSAGPLRVYATGTSTVTAASRDASVATDERAGGSGLELTALLWALLGAHVATAIAYYHHRTRHRDSATVIERLRQ